MLQGEFIPAANKNSRQLFVMLHGLGDSPAGWRWLPETLALPDLNYLLVRAPDKYYDGFSWFDYPNDIAPGILRSRKLLFELLDDLRAKNFPANEITLGGFSQGCLMTLDAGLRYPHQLAGLVGISGWVYEIATLQKEFSTVAVRQRILVTHGHFDPVIPFDPVREQVRQLQTAGLNVTWREYPKAHIIHGAEEISLIREFVRAGYAMAGK